MAAATASGPAVSNSLMYESIVASRADAGTTAWTSPISLARAAEKRAPVRNSSRAAERPILARANGEMTAGTIPSFVSVKPNSASSSATTISQTAARPAPPPSAAPCTRPMTGTGSESMAPNIRDIAVASRMFSGSVYSTVFAIHVTSAPAQNILPAPASTIARGRSDDDVTPSAHCVSSAMTWSLNAFRTSGRFSVRRSTGPSRLINRNWYGNIATESSPQRRQEVHRGTPEGFSHTEHPEFRRWNRRVVGG